MRREDWVCDYCGKSEKGGEHHYGLPKGWYLLGYHGQSYLAYDDWRAPHQFCSLDCLFKAVKVTREPALNPEGE